MSQSLSKVIVHIVFSTKNRIGLILDNELNDLHAFIATVCHHNGSFVFAVGGTEDHVHIACDLPRTISVSGLVAEVKRSSSRWIKENGDVYPHLVGSEGMGCFQ